MLEIAPAPPYRRKKFLRGVAGFRLDLATPSISRQFPVVSDQPMIDYRADSLVSAGNPEILNQTTPYNLSLFCNRLRGLDFIRFTASGEKSPKGTAGKYFQMRQEEFAQ